MSQIPIFSFKPRPAVWAVPSPRCSECSMVYKHIFFDSEKLSSHSWEQVKDYFVYKCKNCGAYMFFCDNCQRPIVNIGNNLTE